MSIAAEDGSTWVETHCLKLGVLEVADGVAVGVLRSYGLDPHQLAEQVGRVISGA